MKTFKIIFISIICLLGLIMIVKAFSYDGLFVLSSLAVVKRDNDTNIFDAINFACEAHSYEMNTTITVVNRQTNDKVNISFNTLGKPYIAQPISVDGNLTYNTNTALKLMYEALKH